jgi:hypothetical protein
MTSERDEDRAERARLSGLPQWCDKRYHRTTEQSESHTTNRNVDIGQNDSAQYQAKSSHTARLLTPKSRSGQRNEGGVEPGSRELWLAWLLWDLLDDVEQLGPVVAALVAELD